MWVVYGRGLIFFKKWLKKNNKFERNIIYKSCMNVKKLNEKWDKLYNCIFNDINYVYLISV